MKVRNILRVALASFHFLIAAGLALAFGYMLTDPSNLRHEGWQGVFILAIPFTIGWGILFGKRWVRWLVLVQIIVGAVGGLLLAAGSVLWPESFGNAVLAITAGFIIVEVGTMVFLGGEGKKNGVKAEAR